MMNTFYNCVIVLYPPEKAFSFSQLIGVGKWNVFADHWAFSQTHWNYRADQDTSAGWVCPHEKCFFFIAKFKKIRKVCVKTMQSGDCNTFISSF